jgi:PadR family transcriptional regulator, regulatory protein PadR
MLGEFEVLVMTGVLAAGDTAYGMTIHEEVEGLVPDNRNVAIGAVYTTLGRLEEKGYVEARFGDPTAERGGRAKKFYKVTAPGMRVLKAALNPMGKALRIVRQWR